LPFVKIVICKICKTSLYLAIQTWKLIDITYPHYVI